MRMSPSFWTTPLIDDSGPLIFFVSFSYFLPFATGFFATGFFATGFLATGFLATGFLATVFLAAGFLATDRLDVLLLYPTAPPSVLNPPLKARPPLNPALTLTIGFPASSLVVSCCCRTRMASSRVGRAPKPEKEVSGSMRTLGGEPSIPPIG